MGKSNVQSAAVQRDIETLRSWIESCPKGGRVFFGGAGVSTDSGIPDFRSSNGLFMRNYQIPPEQIVSHTFFERHPKEFYEFYFKHMVFPDVQPNQAHKKLGELYREGTLRAVVTQNVDGLHQKAGCETVFELHGSAERNYCMRCKKRYSLPEFIALYEQSEDGIPHCPECGGLVRPDVVLYEEGLDQNVMQGAVTSIANASLLVVAGTSLVVYPAAGLLQYFQGSYLVIVNLQPTSADRNADLCIPAKVGDVFNF